MATYKRSKKRPLSLSLSQPSGLESSKTRRKKNISSQHCEGISKTLSLMSEEEFNPRRKFVEEWLAKNNADNCSADSTDENSQDTVLLEGNCCLHRDEETDHVKEVLKDEVDSIYEVVVEQEILKDSVDKQDVVEGNVVKPEMVKDSAVEEVDRIVMPEVVEEQEDSVGKQMVVKEPKRSLVEQEINREQENKATTSSRPVDEEEPLLQCPLCWKNFEKAQTQAAHLKACAAANGLTTRQLIDAVDLHKKQLAERKRLGLFPMAPPPAALKKSAPKKVEGQTYRKGRQPKDSNLELALALSLSLGQGEHRQESLNTFGFTSKTGGPKKSAPVLLTRTQAERERLITEKVAIVLMDEPDGSQPSNDSQELPPTVQSTQLQEWCNENRPLWKKSHTSPSKNDLAAFYVSALGNVIAPSKSEAGANLRHLSQLPGRINTPKKNDKPRESADNSSVSECHSASNTLSLAKLEQDVKAKHLSDWASMLKNSSMSDVAIYVRGGMAIPAHKLVLAVRCPQILHDVTKQQNQVTGLHVDVILWPETSNDAAMCFLEYIYYGSIRSIHTLRKDTSGLEWLANRYEATDLTDVLSYFEGRKRAVKRLSDVASIRSPTPDPVAPVLSGVALIHSQETVPIVNEFADTSSLKSIDKESGDMFFDQEERKDSPVSNLSILSQKTEKRIEGAVSNPSIHSENTERIVSPQSDHSIHSQKTLLSQKRIQSPDIFSDEYCLALCQSPELKNDAGRKMSFDSSLDLDNNVLAHIDGLATGSPAKSSSLRRQTTKQSTSSDDTLKNGAKVLNLSASSDLPSFRGGSPLPFGSQRPISTDDIDVVVISDDEDEVAVPERKNPCNISSVSFESPKSAKSNSPARNSVYISPVWVGFDDMPGDIYMGQDWNCGDEPGTDTSRCLGVSPIRGSSPVFRRDLDTSPLPSVLDTSPERGRIRAASSSSGKGLDSSPVRSIVDTSPARQRGLHTSPVRSIQDTSPVRSDKVHGISDSESSDEESTRGKEEHPVNNLLDDSMNAILASSHLDVLLERRTPKRAKNQNGDENGSESGRVTPMKNYRGMTTPEIKVELQKFGMKPALGRRKGIIMLEYIYNELHPFVPEDEGFSHSQPTTAQPPSHRISCSQPSSSGAAIACKSPPSSSSSSSSSSTEGLSDAEADDSDSGTVMSQRGTKKHSATEIPGIVTKHIENDRVLHRKILEFEPIFVEHLQSDLKNNGYNFKIADLMAYLGHKCINYRSVKSQGGRTRKKNDLNGNPRKKRRPDIDLDLDLPNSGELF